MTKTSKLIDGLTSPGDCCCRGSSFQFFVDVILFVPIVFEVLKGAAQIRIKPVGLAVLTIAKGRVAESTTCTPERS